jgi:hypothetical protein
MVDLYAMWVMSDESNWRCMELCNHFSMPSALSSSVALSFSQPRGGPPGSGLTFAELSVQVKGLSVFLY